MSGPPDRPLNGATVRDRLRAMLGSRWVIERSVLSHDIAAALRVWDAAEEYSPEEDHDWRCKPIHPMPNNWDCVCGYVELQASLAEDHRDGEPEGGAS